MTESFFGHLNDSPVSSARVYQIKKPSDEVLFDHELKDYLSVVSADFFTASREKRPLSKDEKGYIENMKYKFRGFLSDVIKYPQEFFIPEKNGGIEETNKKLMA